MWVLMVVCLYVLAVQQIVNVSRVEPCLYAYDCWYRFQHPPNPGLDNEKKIDGCMVEIF